MPRIIFFAIHNTTRWWKYLGSRIEFAEVTVLSDFRGDGDRSLVDDFYRFMQSGDPAEVAAARFGVDGCAEIILRCRVLRSLDRGLALRMIGGMAQAIERVFDDLDPDFVLTFTMDRYVMDVMERIARARNIDFLEMTTSIIPGEVIFMRRGQLIQLREPTDAHLEAMTRVICQKDFAPVYVRNAKNYSKLQFWKVFSYFALRGAFFNVWRLIRRDPLNLHFLDALKRLKHKVRLRDVTALRLFDHAWQTRIDSVPRERRVFFGLQLFPEASLDYWLRASAMLKHDEIVMRYCDILGRAGYHIFVKDHPLQFGFRQRELLVDLAKLDFVTLVPYEVPANLLIGSCSISITFTGTIGFEAALAGLCSVVTEPYYATEQHYLHVRNPDEIEDLVDRLQSWRPPDDLRKAQREMLRHLTAGSIEGDYYTWRNFNPESQAAREGVEPLVGSLNRFLPRFFKRRASELHSRL